MFISDEEAQRRIEQERAFREVLGTDTRTEPTSVLPSTPPVVIDVPDWTVPERQSRPKRTTEDKAIMGLDALILGPREAARLHGVPVNTVVNYSEGQLVNGEPNEALIKAIEEKKTKVRDKAFDRLMKTLDGLTDERIDDEDLSAVEVSQIAANLSRVTDKMMPHGMGDDDRSRHVHFTIMQPQPRDESTYATITVGASRT